MANAGNTSVNNSNKDNDYIIEISDDKDLQLERLVVLLYNVSNEEYTLYNKYRVIVDNIKS
jgi:hypothetical protein